MQLYFNSSVAGGDNNNDFGDANNYWQDLGWTVPNGALPLSSDNVQLDDFVSILSGSVSLNNLTTSSSSYYFNPVGSSFGIAGSGTCTGVNVQGGAASITFSLFLGCTISGALNIGTINASGCTFASVDQASIIIGSSGCQYNVSMNASIIDDGTGSFGAYTFTGTVSYNGNLNASSTSFSGTVYCGYPGSGAPSPNAYISAGTFTGSVYSNNIIGGAFSGSYVYMTGLIQNYYSLSSYPVTTTWTSVTGINGGIDIQSLNWGGNSGATVTVTLPNSQVLYYTPVPSASQVLTGVLTNGFNGTVELPSASQVRSGVAFGINGASMGTFIPNGSVGYFG